MVYVFGFTSLLQAQVLTPGPSPAVSIPPFVPAPIASPHTSALPSTASPDLPASLPPPRPAALPASYIVPSGSIVPAGSMPSSTLIFSGSQTPSISPTPSSTASPSGERTSSSGTAPLSSSGTSPLIPAPASALSPLPIPTPFPTVPLITPPPGAFSVPSPGGAQPNFPSAILPPPPGSPPAPPIKMPRIRVAKTTELGVNAPKLTLDDAVKYALNHNPDVLNAVEQIRLTTGQFISVRSQLLPQLVISGTFYGQAPILSNPPRPARDSTAATAATATSADSPLQSITLTSTPYEVNNYSWNIQFAAQQLLFDGGGALSSTIAAHYIEDQAYFKLRSVIDDIIAKIKIAFFQVVLNRALIIVQEQSVALLENQLEDQESRYQAGTVPKFNVLQAQVAVANAIPPLITARNNLRISQYQLVQLLGMNYTGDPTKVPFNVVGDLTVKFRTIVPEESIRIGLTRNPSLKAQRESILSQAANVTAALSGFYPRITASAGYMVQNNYNYLNLTKNIEGWFFGFAGTWYIFDGLNTYGKVVQTKAQLEQAKINYDNTVRTVILNIQQDISNLQEAQETIESQQASVIQATEALRLSRERLSAGAGTQLDILNAQVALLQAQTTVLQAQFDYIQALAQYDAALSLNTRYVETFRDPLEDKEKWRFARLNGAGYKMPPLPRVYRKKDPVVPILGPTPTPKPFFPPLPPIRTTTPRTSQNP